MSITNLLLVPMSWLFRLGVFLRNKAFDAGLLRTTGVGVPVISVGNVTVGGTGKTPLTEFVVRHCLGRGKRVAIVSRGYKRATRGALVVSDGKRLFTDARHAGDEPVQLARKFPEAIVVVSERKVEAAQYAVNVFHPDAVVLDDGFQHRYLKRDLDIVVVNVAGDDVDGRLLPAGRNREPWSAVRRAGLVALSNAVREDRAEQWKSELGRWYSGEWVEFRYKTVEGRRLSDHETTDLESLREKRVFAFSGIGHHRQFLESIKSLGCILAGDAGFADHHAYNKGDIKGIIARMDETGAEYCITTEKDAVRLMADREMLNLFQDRSILYTKIEIDVISGKEVLIDSIDSCLQGKIS